MNGMQNIISSCFSHSYAILSLLFRVVMPCGLVGLKIEVVCSPPKNGIYLQVQMILRPRRPSTSAKFSYIHTQCIYIWYCLKWLHKNKILHISWPLLFTKATYILSATSSVLHKSGSNLFSLHRRILNNFPTFCRNNGTLINLK